MTINWKQRDPVFRLLAAVYAELDEEGLKGRYGRIAKFYGPDATYDAIKSFFAKEIARAAQGLKAQNPNLLERRHAVSQRQITRPRRGPLHLDFNDDGVSILHEQVAQSGFIQALQRPAKRQRVSRPPAPAEVLFSKVAIPDQAPNTAFSNGYTADELPDTHDDAADVATQDSVAQTEILSSLQDSFFEYPQQPRPADQQWNSEHHEDVSNSAVQSMNIVTTTDLQSKSYGYVTNDGKFRCALCRSQVASEEALQKHEQISNLHLQNLSNLFMVSRAQAKMAQVAYVPSIPPHQNSSVPSRPLQLGGFNQHTLPDTSVIPSSSRIATSPSENVNGHQIRDQGREDSPLDMIEVRCRSPAVQETNQHIASSRNDLRKDKGKGRASSVPVDAVAPMEKYWTVRQQTPLPQDSENETHRTLQENMPAATRPTTHFTKARNPPKSNSTVPALQLRIDVDNETSKPFTNPTHLAEVLRSTGMQLADLQRGLAAAAAGIEKRGNNGPRTFNSMGGDERARQQGYRDVDREKFRSAISID